MTLVASRLAAEQLVAQFFLRRELVRSCLDVVIFGCEGLTSGENSYAEIAKAKQSYAWSARARSATLRWTGY